ncbi:transcriptional regulator family: Fungal Specific TF [Penicillium waksmanii]|uniref:transcriptional regulator family: Fungal Specific TF n=1 Tax=Penicillium waksmanii TaxID=69791 RepID=UPI002548106F|nr:transcriptional regulator family: Fungal Specific TF [Penicillium waksmanii]KAJ5995096.1 transcriptional regulator family: Fungal Specific TF [Penicillium waksmanii]
MEPADSDREVPSALAQRAIRCDKRSPCSNCRSANIACRSTGEGQKQHEPRRRVLISSQYRHPHQPRSFIGIHQHPPRQNKGPRSAAKPDHVESKGPNYRSNAAIEQHDSNSGFEGGSSLSAHSAYAREFLESAVSHGTPEMFASPKISEALASLKHIVDMQNRRRDGDDQKGTDSSRDSRLGVRCDIHDLEMPPLPIVLEVVRAAKENPPSAFAGWIPFLTIDYFVEKCQGVYFATDDYAETTFIITNFGLYTIFMEYQNTGIGQISKDEYLYYMQLSKDNLEAALANLNILMPATFDSIAALALGAIHGIEISKPSVGWTLASTAIHMAQTLGYHRLSSMENESKEVQDQRQSLFWSIDTLLNILSLRLGRGSVVQDYDITIPPPLASMSRAEPWGPVSALWCKQAAIQNRMYTMLYSPAALKRPEKERVSHARQLAEELLSSVIEPFNNIVANGANFSEIDKLYVRSDEVSRYATLTLIYRAIPVPPGSDSGLTFIPECIDSARAALEAHQLCMSDLKETDEMMRISYLHWAVFLSPFIPFIVIFCHVIATSDQKDLSRLEDFIASLRPLCRFSQSVDRLHGLCSVLGSVARLYIEAKSRDQAGEDQSLASVGQEFDAYLSALGLAPGNLAPSAQTYYQTDGTPMQMSGPDTSQQGLGLSTPAFQQQTEGSMSIAEMSQAAQLGNWFSSNQHMLGLLEEDIFQVMPNS